MLVLELVELELELELVNAAVEDVDVVGVWLPWRSNACIAIFRASACSQVIMVTCERVFSGDACSALQVRAKT